MAAPTVTPARASERVDFRSASARLRENAGIRDTAAVAAVASVAEVGAAARRLRASNTFAEPPARDQHPAGSALPGAEASPPTTDDEPIVIDLPACEVIYLDPQIGRRKIAAASDRDLRCASLAQRAATLLASIEDAKLSLV